MAMVEVEQALSLSASFEKKEAQNQKGDENKHDQHGNSSSRSSSRASSKSGDSLKPLPQYQYTKDELLGISKSEGAKKRPEYLNRDHNNSFGLWDPLNWFASLRNEEIPPSDNFRPKRPVEYDRESSGPPKRRSSDPKERIKEEKDDIVLSPQRGSFVTGCHVTQQSSLARRARSPSDGREPDSNAVHREPTRRIGSGRIANRDRDHPERDYGYSRRGGDRREEREKEGTRFSGRFGERRFGRGRSGVCIKEEEEPEWFSGGPTSQSETIELVGFEDLEKSKAKSEGKPDKDKEKLKEGAELKLSHDNMSKQSENQMELPNHEESSDKVLPVLDESEDSEQTENEPPPRDPSPGFDFNEIFQMDLIPGIVSNGDTEEPKPNIFIENSKFSNWFQDVKTLVGDQEPEGDSQHSSFQDELVANMLKGIDDSHSLIQFSPPANASDTSFLTTDASLPQALFQADPLQLNLSQNKWSKPTQEKNILDILKNANINVQPLLNGDNLETADLKEKELAQKAISVEEIEADLKQLVLGGKEQKETSPLNKLLKTDKKSPLPISLGPLDKSKVLQEEDIVGALLTDPGTTSCQAYQNSYMTQKINSVPRNFMDSQTSNQSQRLAYQMNTFGMLDTKKNEKHLNPMSRLSEQEIFRNTVASVDIFKNKNQQSDHTQESEDRELLSGLLHQPLSVGQNLPFMSSYNQDSSIQQSLSLPPGGSGLLTPRQSPLTTECHGRIPSPLVFGQQPPVLSHAPSPIHPTQLSRKSNTLQVEPNPVIPRIPSPQELAAHTQSILQNALIKHKLAEQQEKYRKRQEALRTHSPIIHVSVNSPSPSKCLSPTMVAFTPTSVIRKMHTDKSDRGIGKLDTISAVSGLQSLTASQSMKLGQDLSTTNQPSVGPFPSHMLGVDRFIRQDVNSVENTVSQIPRALHGQGASRILGSGQPFTSHGRPIVKAAGGYNMSGDRYSRPGSKFGNAPNKPFPIGNYQNSQDLVSKVAEQHRFQHPHNFVNVNRPPPGHFSSISRPQGPVIGNNPNTPSLARPGNLSTSFQQHFDSGNFNPSAPRVSVPPNTINQLAQLLAQHQQQQILSRSRAMPNQLALQQLLLTAHQQSAASQGQSVNQGNLHTKGDGRGDISLMGYPTHKGQQMIQGNRQPSTNLAKWFGNEVLKEKLPEMPPVPHQRAVLVEELERQQQGHSLEHM
ncbi:eukaryotic translation initiation factor 4E transporter-like isoform X1 [Tachypleus tridentatus]|uniref:eukaryotic translation initiation factor 4E transporter-like isoform X1 n=1 Tax=Tachypleus tridentatus TaxID=6853 RepID=UPI003FD67772